MDYSVYHTVDGSSGSHGRSNKGSEYEEEEEDEEVPMDNSTLTKGEGGSPP